MIPPISRIYPERRPQIHALILCLTLACWAQRAHAQGFDATNLREPADLAAGWLVHAGDDPAYARPDFDDSHWTPFNAATDSLYNLFPNSRPAVVWYRLHVKVASDQTGLALLEYNISWAFEIYTNGVRLLKVGQVAPFAPYNPFAEILLPIPGNQIATQAIVIALRVHLSATDWAGITPGYFSTNLAIGAEGTLRDRMWLAIIGNHGPEWVVYLSNLAMCIGALLLFLTQRERPEYLWLFLETLCLMPYTVESVFSSMHTYPVIWAILCLVLETPWPYFSMRMYCTFFGQRVGWKLNVFAALAGVTGIYGGIARMLGVASGYQRLVFDTPYVVLMAVILPTIMIKQIRRGKRLEGILLIPLLLSDIGTVSDWSFLAASQIPMLRSLAAFLLSSVLFIHVGPFSIYVVGLGALLGNFSLALIILIRSNRISRQQAVLESEVASAREVQQVILPEAVQSVPGFRIESIYEPAREVGGDFFQILPAAENGLLLVVGDVAGKGMPAAMLVSLLVGTIRTAAENTHAPDRLLSKMNERLLGRTRGGFSTALVAHFASDGSVTIANAGHLPPYLDGQEVELPGALPLGIARDVQYETTRIRIEPSSRLTFYSDGVIEAQDRSGQLFGFDRARKLSTQPAAVIAEAAKAFGQQDDITVIAVERVAVEERREVERTTAIWAPA